MLASEMTSLVMASQLPVKKAASISPASENGYPDVGETLLGGVAVQPGFCVGGGQEADLLVGKI